MKKMITGLFILGALLACGEAQAKSTFGGSSFGGGQFGGKIVGKRGKIRAIKATQKLIVKLEVLAAKSANIKVKLRKKGAHKKAVKFAKVARLSKRLAHATKANVLNVLKNKRALQAINIAIKGLKNIQPLQEKQNVAIRSIHKKPAIFLNAVKDVRSQRKQLGLILRNAKNIGKSGSGFRPTPGVRRF